MKVDCVTLMQPCSSIKGTSFKGLWGDSVYEKTESLYGGEFYCDYYSKTYYPFADETKSQIKNEMAHMDEEINVPENSLSKRGTYTKLLLGGTLLMTAAEYGKLLRKEFPECLTKLIKK